jgi:hypothetical protein
MGRAGVACAALLLSQHSPDAMTMPTKVFILTYCRSLGQLYGNLLTFSTVRVGFLDAEITVYDNASLEGARTAIRLEAKQVGASYEQLTTEMLHHDFLRSTIIRNPGARLVFLDPDLIFWSNVETHRSDALMSGRLIPTFDDVYTGTLTYERLHTSLLIVNDSTRLARTIADTESRYFDADLIAPRMIFDGEWRRWDSMAQLYAVTRDQCEVFDADMLDRYDHLFCGTHLNLIRDRVADHALIDVHQAAKQAPASLRGLWRSQQEFFDQQRRTPRA